MGIAIPTNYVTLTKVMQDTHLIDTQIGIILIYASQMIPFDVFLIYAFVDSVPRELDEAAFIDGCSPLHTFFRVILPLLRPVLITCGVLNVLNVWSDFINPLYFLSNQNNWPMTLSVFNFFGTGAYAHLFELGSGVRRCPDDDPARHPHLHRRPALDPVGPTDRLGQGIISMISGSRDLTGSLPGLKFATASRR